MLNVISRSPAEVQPVLDGIVETAGRLCQADHAHVFRLREGKYHLAAHNRTDPHVIEYLAKNPIGLNQRGSVTARASAHTQDGPRARRDARPGIWPRPPDIRAMIAPYYPCRCCARALR